MANELIKSMLKTGECPICNAAINTEDDLKLYKCSEKPEHFTLKITLIGGERIDAELNGKKLDASELEGIEW